MSFLGDDNIVSLVDEDDPEQLDQQNAVDEFETDDDEVEGDERVLSVLKHSLSLVQMHMSLEDRTELQVKLCYSHMKDKWVSTVEELS